MKVLICTVGSRGDVQPMLVLGRALAERGHGVRIAAPPNFEQRIRADGFDWLAIGSDTERLIAENQGLAERQPLLALPSQIALLRRETERQLEDILRAPQPADLVIGAGLAFGARPCAERLNARYVYVCYTLAGILAEEHPPAAVPLFGLPRWVNRLLWQALIRGFDWSMRLPIDRVRRAHGLGRDPEPWRNVHAARTLLAQDAIMGELPAGSRGFCHHVPALVSAKRERQPPPQRVERFLLASTAARSRVAYIGFGSMPTIDRERVIRAAIELHRTTQTRVLVACAKHEQAGQELAPGVLAVPALDHAQLFPRVDLVVHHGGAGTTATALRAGVPQFIVPHIVDQFFHGRRIAELGLGPSPVPKARLDEAALLAAFHASQRCAPRAREVGEALAESSGAPAAVDYLEQRMHDATAEA